MSYNSQKTTISLKVNKFFKYNIVVYTDAFTWKTILISVKIIGLSTASNSIFNCYKELFIFIVGYLSRVFQFIFIQFLVILLTL